ncbi:MAG: hypothetical protein ACJAZV_002163 [Roseivirga sp.]
MVLIWGCITLAVMTRDTLESGDKTSKNPSKTLESLHLLMSCNSYSIDDDSVNPIEVINNFNFFIMPKVIYISNWDG